MFSTFEFKFSDMRLTLLFLFAFVFLSNAQKQVPFTGKLVYSIQICDTSLQKLIPVKYMTIYTNDTLLRIENQTDQLGDQVLIKHMGMNKSYLLLQTPLTNYAIQTNHSTEKIDSFPFTYKKKFGKKKICGLKANKLMVHHSEFSEDLEFLYFKKYNSKYLNSFFNYPGLLVKYYLPTMDGIYEYKLTYIEEMKPDHDLFGIPSDYKKVTFDQFMEEIMQMREGSEMEEHE